MVSVHLLCYYLKMWPVLSYCFNIYVASDESSEHAGILPTLQLATRQPLSLASQWQTRRRSQDLRQDQPCQADNDTSHQPTASECHVKTFSYLAVTHRGTSKDSHGPQSASVLHRWCKERIQEELGSCSLSFINLSLSSTDMFTDNRSWETSICCPLLIQKSLAYDAL